MHIRIPTDDEWADARVAAPEHKEMRKQLKTAKDEDELLNDAQDAVTDILMETGIVTGIHDAGDLDTVVESLEPVVDFFKKLVSLDAATQMRILSAISTWATLRKPQDEEIERIRLMNGVDSSKPSN